MSLEQRTNYTDHRDDGKEALTLKNAAPQKGKGNDVKTLRLLLSRQIQRIRGSLLSRQFQRQGVSARGGHRKEKASPAVSHEIEEGECKNRHETYFELRKFSSNAPT